MKKKLLILALVLSAFTSVNSFARDCSSQTIGGGIVGGIFGAIIGEVVFDRPVVGGLLGAGTGAIVANKSCNAQNAFNMSLSSSYGEFYEWRDLNQYGYFEVVSQGAYYQNGSYFADCREITSYYYEGNAYTFEEYDVSETRLFCHTSHGLEVFENYTERYYIVY